MWRLRSLASAFLAGVVAACAVVDPVDMRYDTIGRSLAKARNEAIFLNLVRASQDDPLNFVTIANVTPSLSNTSSFALPSFLLGPSPRNVEPGFSPGRDAVLGSSTASNTTAISTNFNVSTEETSAFYNGFLKPIDLQTLDYFIRQGYSRELLFWLFTQSVEIVAPPPRPRLLYTYDPPKDYGCPKRDPRRLCFREFVLLAIYSGLTVEERAVEDTQSSANKAQQKGNPNNISKRNLPVTTSYFRFCFDALLGEKARHDMDPTVVSEIKTKYLSVDPGTLRPLCGDRTWDPRKDNPVQEDMLSFNAGQIKFRIMPRSAFGVFEFLGTLIKMQGANPPSPPQWIDHSDLRTEVMLQPPELATVSDDPKLFTVTSGRDGNCFVQTWFKGESFCVPDDALTTKRIFNLLAQLVAIETAATDLSITPTVRVVQ
jgi:hypothetical protein